MTKHTASDTVLRRHPIRGALWGVPLGAGAALHLLGFGIIPFGAWPLLAAPVAGAICIGVLWGNFGPARATKSRLSPARRGTGDASAERRSAAEVRAVQLLAARQANEELHDLAAADDDNAMQAALHEAEKDVVEVRSRKSRSTIKPTPKATAAERSSAIAATPPPRQASDQVEVTSPALIDLVTPAPAADASAQDVALAHEPSTAAPAATPVPASPPLSLTDPTHPDLPLTDPALTDPVDLVVAPAPTEIAAAVSAPVSASPMEPTLAPEAATVHLDVADALVPSAPATIPAAAVPVETSAAPAAAALQAETVSTPAAALPEEPVEDPARAATLPDVTTTQDLTPFANSPLPADVDEERAAADKLEAQLEAALREAMAVTLGSR